MRIAKKIEGRKCPICGSEENQMNYGKIDRAHKDANTVTATLLPIIFCHSSSAPLALGAERPHAESRSLISAPKQNKAPESESPALCCEFLFMILCNN
jgi:hypothetical protein